MNEPKNVIEYEFAYEKHTKELYTPKATVVLKSPKNQKEVRCEAIVDTGSQITLVSSELIKTLQLPIAGEKQIINTAGSGEFIYALPCWGQVSFYDQNIVSQYNFVKIYSCQKQYLSQDILLGMNFINKYTIIFSGKEKKIIVKQEKK